MYINNNIPALQTLNSLTRATGALQKSIQKLSKGLRVNSAADDAAGLAISEKMRAQIGGLDQAERNSQDAISLIQTAEGALGEIHSNLQRMRELAVQAANDTITQNDREYIQLEVEQLKEEINRIATTTQFNKMRVLDGMASAVWSSDKLSTEAIVRGAFAGRDEFGQKVSHEGNFRIEIQAKPGTGQMLKSHVFNVSYEPVPPEPPVVPEAPPPVTTSRITATVTPPAPATRQAIDLNSLDSVIVSTLFTGMPMITEHRYMGYRYNWTYNYHAADTAAGILQYWTLNDASKQVTIDGVTSGAQVTDFNISGNTNANLVVNLSYANIVLNGADIATNRNAAAFSVNGGNVNLYLGGTNSSLTGGTGANYNYAGLSVAAGGTLTVTSLSGDYMTSGTLNATGGSSGGAGIECNNGNIKINGGTINASGGVSGGSGIGGGNGTGSGNITINGGAITATGGASSGAGIGYLRGNITINGGTVMASGGYNGTGIGNASGNITIANDLGTTKVTATGGVNGAGIGGGVGDVYIIDFETLTAAGGYNGAGIGGSSGVSGGNITIVGGENTIYANGADGGAGIGGGNAGSGGNVKIFGGTVNTNGGNDGGAGIGGGAGGSGGNLQFMGGTTTAQGGADGAGIGGGRNGGGGTVELYDGTINTAGGDNAAGIGGGDGGSGGIISLINLKEEDGEIVPGKLLVNAKGGGNGAGVGGGNTGSGGDINLYSGDLNSTGGAGGSGVGGGAYGSGGEIVIASGNLTLQGEAGGAGMGGGIGGAGGNITVYGGSGNITGGGGGTGMGGGQGGDGAVITIPYGLHNDAIPVIRQDYIFTLKGRLYATAGIGGKDNIDTARVIEEMVTKVLLPLKDISQFYDGAAGYSGITGEPGSGTGGKGFSVYNPQILTIYQGDGKTASVTLYGYDTMYSVAEKINDAIAFGLGQSAYIKSSYRNFCTISEGAEGTSESIYTDSVPVYEEVSVRVGTDENGMDVYRTENRVKGYDQYATMLVRSVIPGAEGELKFSGDEGLLKALGLATIRESRESEFYASVCDAHTGETLKSSEKITGNVLYGAVSENVDVSFDPLADIKVTWNEKMKQFDFDSDGGTYSTVVHIADRSMTFQIGANENEDMIIGIGNMNSSSLGVHKVLVVDRDSASRAITIVDSAIDRVSKQRASLGAYQNRLEHTINNLTVASENLTASESRIRDLDMAKEMMNFTKLNIIVQSSQAMLSQANQLPDGVLTLLR